MKNPLLPWLKSREIQLLQRKRAPAKRRERKKRDIRRGLEAKFINSLYSHYILSGHATSRQKNAATHFF
jgi:hypothetical protein